MWLSLVIRKAEGGRSFWPQGRFLAFLWGCFGRPRYIRRGYRGRRLRSSKQKSIKRPLQQYLRGREEEKRCQWEAGGEGRRIFWLFFFSAVPWVQQSDESKSGFWPEIWLFFMCTLGATNRCTLCKSNFWAELRHFIILPVYPGCNYHVHRF